MSVSSRVGWFAGRTSVGWVEAIPWYEDGLVVGLAWLCLGWKGEVDLPVGCVRTSVYTSGANGNHKWKRKAKSSGDWVCHAQRLFEVGNEGNALPLVASRAPAHASRRPSTPLEHDATR